MLRWVKSTHSPGTKQLHAILRNVTLGKVHPFSWNPTASRYTAECYVGQSPPILLELNSFTLYCGMLRWAKSTHSPGTLQLHAILRNVTLGKVHPLSWNPPKRGLGHLMFPPEPPSPSTPSRISGRLPSSIARFVLSSYQSVILPSFGSFLSANSCLSEVFLPPVPVFLKFSFCQFLSF